MRRNVTLVLILFLCISTSSVKAQFNLIVNELSQGTNGSKEFVELLVVGTRTCMDSTADLRNWIFDDHNGWYAGAGSGIAAGHYRFSNSTNWEKVPYGSIILIYNNADRNTKIPAGTDDPTDANKDYKYQLPITNALIQQNDATPVTPSSPSYTYPTTGYGTSSDWVSIGLANSGDGIIIVNPANRGVAHFSIVFGLGAGGGAFQVPTVQKPNVDGGSNLYLSNDLYTNAASWIIGDAGTADETPGTPNTTANATWINSMRVQASLPGSVSGNITQPTCATPTGTITVTGPTGTGYTYSINGTTFQASPVFAGLAPGSYTITVKNADGCSVTATITINPVPGAPAAPAFTLTQPTCTTPTGTITITAPTGTGLTYSINGTTFQAGTTFTGVTPGTYTVTVRNAAGCNSTANAVINAVPGAPAAATATVTQPTCTTPTGTITITAPTGTGLEYSINGTTFQTTTTFAGLAPNTYTITVRNAAGCTSTATATVNAVPSAPAAATATVTQPTCTTPTGTITITTPTGTGLEYSINGTTFQTTTTFAGLAPNTYTITVRNAAGCTSTATATVNAVPASPSAPIVTTPVTYCLNATAVALTATGTNLLWYTAASGGTGSGTAPVPATTAAGSINYYVSQSNGGCESPRAMITVTVTDINVAAITGNTSICAAGANTTTLANTTTGGTWSSSNTAVATVSNAGVVTGLSAGTTTISYSVTSGSCTKAVTAVVTVNDFTLNLTSSATTVPQGNAFTLSTSAATNYQVTAWLPLATFTNQAALTQTLIASANATYSAVALSAAGCIDTASITITVSAPEKHEVFVPNVFSPNGDGKNDILKVYSTTLKSMEFSIFNQWGEMIFRTTNINGGWDGTSKGKLQPGTVYIYVLKAVMVDNSIINKKGSVTLLR